MDFKTNLKFGRVKFRCDGGSRLAAGERRGG